MFLSQHLKSWPVGRFTKGSLPHPCCLCFWFPPPGPPLLSALHLLLLRSEEPWLNLDVCWMTYLHQKGKMGKAWLLFHRGNARYLLEKNSSLGEVISKVSGNRISAQFWWVSGQLGQRRALWQGTEEPQLIQGRNCRTRGTEMRLLRQWVRHRKLRRKTQLSSTTQNIACSSFLLHSNRWPCNYMFTLPKSS